jgi:hypothetical protein
MNKTPSSKAPVDSLMHNFLFASIIIMTVPLFLEFAIYAPLLATHILLGDAFRVFSIVIAATGVIAAILGAISAILYLLNRKQIKDPKVNSLGNWVLGLAAAYVLIFGFFTIAYFNIGG